METQFLLAIHQNLASPGLDRMFKAFTLLGDNKLLAPLFAALAVYFWLRKDKVLSGIALALGFCEIAATELLKIVVHRARPELWERIVTVRGGSFPSGHAAGTAAFFGFSAWLLARAYPQKRAAIWTFLILFLALMGLSRLYLGVHWPTDILGGWAVGGTLAILAAAAARRLPAGLHKYP